MSAFDDIFSQNDEEDHQVIPKVGTGMFGKQESYGTNKQTFGQDSKIRK